MSAFKMPLNKKALASKVAELLDREEGVEMVANPHHLPTVSTVLLHIVYQELSRHPSDKEDLIRFFGLRNLKIKLTLPIFQ